MFTLWNKKCSILTRHSNHIGVFLVAVMLSGVNHCGGWFATLSMLFLWDISMAIWMCFNINIGMWHCNEGIDQIFFHHIIHSNITFIKLIIFSCRCFRGDQVTSWNIWFVAREKFNFHNCSGQSNMISNDLQTNVIDCYLSFRMVVHINFHSSAILDNGSFSTVHAVDGASIWCSNR